MAKKFLRLGIVAMVLVFGMAVVGCDNSSTNDPPPISESTQVTASSSGELSINYNGGIMPIGLEVIVTTNLPSPNNRHTFTDLGTWNITGLSPNELVDVTVTARISQIDLNVMSNSVMIFVWM